MTIQLSNVNVDVPEDKKNKIQLSEDMTIELKYPTYNSVINDKIMRHSESGSEIMYQTVLLSLDALQAKDERMIFAEEPIEDVVNFIGNLTNEQFKKLSEFSENIPMLRKEIQYSCDKCQHKNLSIIEGTADFFL